MRHVVDARGLLCPLPVIRAQDAVSELSVGDELQVLATDPGALHDIPAWSRVHGHTLLETQQSGDTISILIRVERHS